MAGRNDDIALTPLIWNRVPDVHYKEQVSYLTSIGRADAEFQSTGYRRLGDRQHRRSDRRETYRVYGGSDDGTFGLWGIAGSFNMQWFFYSLLDDGFWVTTATFRLLHGAPRPAIDAEIHR